MKRDDPTLLLNMPWQTVQDDLPALIALLEPLVLPQEDA